MKSILFSLLLLCASPCFAAYLPTIPYDGNGNTPGVVQDASGNFLIDSGARTATMTNSNGNAIGIDLSTRSLQTIEYEHHEIHAGSFYRAGYQLDVGNGDTTALTFTTPDTTKWMHWRPAVDVEGQAAIMVYEGSTVTGGVAITPRNSNRNYADSSSMTVVAAGGVNVASATRITNIVLGSGKSSGGNSESGFEWVLKQNTTYTLLVTNESGAANEVNIRCQWYEHTNKVD